MRVTLITDAPYCFDVRTQRNVKALEQLGYEITVIDQGFESDRSRQVLAPEHTLVSSEVPKAGFARSIWHVKNRLLPLSAYQKRSAWAVQKIEESKPDIVHCVNPMLVESAQIAAHNLGAKFIYEAYEYWPEYLFQQGGRIPKDLGTYLYYAEKNAAKSADYFITVGEPLLEWYREEQGFKAGEVVYNANVAAQESTPPTPFEAPLKVIHSGNLFKSRNVSLLIEAANLVKHPISVIIVGDGPEKSFLYDHSLSLKHKNADVLFLDAVPPSELIELLSSSDVGVHLVTPDSKQTDGAVPNKFFDYMRAGIALISTDSTGARSLNNYSDFMVLLPELTKEALAQVFDDLSESPQRVDALRQAAYGAGKEYSSEHAIGQIIALYKKLAGDL